MSTPYLVIPSNGSNYLNISGNTSTFAPSFSVQTPSQPVVAPKHAHHLHSIPPKQKSTKSLILDHLLWLHALARIAHVGAEQGISVIRDDGDEGNDRGSTSLCEALNYGSGHGRPGLRLLKTRVDFVRARALKARAEGLERVLTAMIDGQKDSGPLPDSVRFRLMLGALINDIFAPQPPSRAPADPSRPQRPQCSIPDALLPLSKSTSAPSDRFSMLLPSFSSLTSPRAPTSSPGASHPHGWSQPLGSSSHNDSASSQPSLRHTNTRAKELYSTGVDNEAGSTSSSRPQPLRCYRHLRPECQSCTSPLSSVTSIGAGLSRSADGRPFKRVQPDAQSPDADLKSRILEIIPQFLALSALVCTEMAREEERRRSQPQQDDDNDDDDDDDDDDDRDPMHSSESFASSFTSSGTHHQSSSDLTPPPSNVAAGPTSEGPKSRKLSLPFPFNRGNSTPNDTRPTLSPITKSSVKGREPVVRPTREWYGLLAALLTRAVLEGYLIRGWKGTSALEIILNIGHAEEPVQRTRRLRKPSTRGLFSRKGPEEDGSPPVPQSSDPSSLTPDDLPNLSDAASVLFGKSLREGKSTNSLSGADTNPDELLEEYSRDMERRLSEFLNIPAQARDLTSHLETLSERYPAEPVEAGVLRFCEAIAVWRGKPELEEYKRGNGPTQSSIRSDPYYQARDDGHSRTSSIHSNSSMIYQSPEKARNQPLPTSNSAQTGGQPDASVPVPPAPRTSSSPAPSMSIASLIHPPSSKSGYDSNASSSSFLPLPKPSKLLIDYFFALEEDVAPSVSQSTDIILPPVSAVLEQHAAKARNPLDRWTRFTLGAKRPRDPVRDVILEGERTGKKSHFVDSGKFNT